MRFKATIFVLIVLLSSLSGCLTNENPAPAGNDNEAWLNKFEFKNPSRSLIIGEIEVTNLVEEQRSRLYSIIQHQRSIDFNSDEIPNQGVTGRIILFAAMEKRSTMFFPSQIFSRVIQRVKSLSVNSTIPVGSLSVTKKLFAP